MGIHVHEPCVFEKLNEMVGDGIVKARVRPPAQEDLVEAQRFRRRYWIPGDALVVVIQNNHRAVGRATAALAQRSRHQSGSRMAGHTHRLPESSVQEDSRWLGPAG